MKEFTVTVPREHTFREGYGVLIDLVWEDDSDTISDVDASVVRIAEDLVSIVGGVPCVATGWGSYVPVENFLDEVDDTYDDTHDLRSRWFETQEEAQEHMEHTLTRWASPAPWESFVRT